MNKVTSYLKNVSKSTAYATVDVVGKLVPEVTDFADTNQELFKAVYATVSHSKRAINYGKKMAVESQIYKDINKGISNVFEDIRSGNFYNKERSDKMIDETGEALAGGYDDFGDDFDFDDFDFDDGSLDDFSDKPAKKPSVSQGDVVIADSVSKSSNLSAQLISKTVASTSRAMMQNNAATTNIMMAQNVELMAGLRTSISGVHQSINQILKFNSEAVTTQINNQSAFFGKTESLLTENNNMLKQLVEIQQNMYKQQEKKESSDQFDKIFSGSTVDLTEYFKVVWKNIKNLDSSGMGEMMLGTGMGGSTMLGQMLSNPLGSLMTGLVAGFMPKTTVKAIASFSKTLGGLFPSMLSKINRWKDDSGLRGIIGKIFGIKTDNKKTIDTDKYNKGAVPFDGITRKAIVDVIPEHLSKIESLLAGNSQRVYDYDTGKWISAKDIKKKKDDDYTTIIKDTFSELSDDIKRYQDTMIKSKNVSYNDKVKFEKDVVKMMTKVFEDGGWMSPANIKKNSGSYEFESGDLIEGLLDALTKVPLSKLASVAERTASNKRRYGDKIREDELSGISILRKLVDNSGMDSHLKFDKTFKNEIIGMNTNTSIAGARDSYGKNVLDYLYEIQETLSYIRDTGTADGFNHQQRKISYEDYKKQRQATWNPKNITDAVEKQAKQKTSYESSNYNENSTSTDLENAIITAIFQTSRKSTDLDEDEFKQFGTRLSNTDNKYVRQMNKIPGKNFGEKWKNAHSFNERYSLLMGSLSNAAKKPATLLEDLIGKANESIYHMLFEAEFDPDLDDDQTGGIKGLYGTMMNKMTAAWTDLTENLNKKILDPLAKKFGLDERWENVKNWAKNTKFAEMFRNAKDSVSASLRSNFSGLYTFASDSVMDTASAFPTVAKMNVKRYENKRNKEQANVLQSVLNDTNSKPRNYDPEQFMSVPKNVVKEAAGRYFNTNKLNAGGDKYVKNDGWVFARKGEAIVPPEANPYNLDPEYVLQNFLREQQLAPKLGAARFTQNRSESIEIKNKYDQKIKSINDKKKYGKEELVDPVIQETKKIINSVKTYLGVDGDTEEEQKQNAEKEKNKVVKNVGNVIKEMGGKGADTIAKSIIGGGLGLLSGVVGGPLIGAAVGAGTSIIKNSETVQKFLFGDQEFDENGMIVSQKGGKVSKDVQNAFKKYAPDAAKFGITGAVASLLLPFGPLAGAAIGAGASFIKNSSTMNEMIFGKEIIGEDGKKYRDDSGLLTPDRINKIKQYYPKATVGAIAGLALGPFGMLGNAAVGAGIGMITGTEEFKNLILGEPDQNGVRFGGLKGALEDNFVKPLREFGQNFKDDFFSFIKESMIDPLNRAITPIANEIAFQTKKVVFGIPKFFAKLGKEYIGKPLMARLNDYFISPLGSATKKIVGGVGRKVKGAISLPFRTVGAVGDHFRRKQIREGRDTVGSAKNRLQFATDNKMGDYNYKDFDALLAGKADEGDTDYLEELTYKTGMLAHGGEYFEKQVKSTGKQLSQILAKYYKFGWFAKDNASYKRIKKYIKDNDVESAINELTEIQNSRTSGGRLDNPEANMAINEFAKANKSYQDAKAAREKFGDLSQNEIKKWLEEQNLGNLKDMDAESMFKYASKELAKAGGKNISARDLFNPAAMISKGEEKTHEYLQDIVKLLKGEPIDISKDEKYNSDVENAREKASNKIESRKNRISKSLANNGIKDTSQDVIDKLYESNSRVLELILTAANNGVAYDEATIIKLTEMDLSKEQIMLLEAYPHIAKFPKEVIEKFTNKNRNNLAKLLPFADKNQRGRNLKALNDAAINGIDVGDIKTAEMITRGGKIDKTARSKRMQYYKKFEELGLIGSEVNIGKNTITLTKNAILDIEKGLTYSDMDKIIENGGGTADIDHSIKTSPTSFLHNTYSKIKHRTIDPVLGEAMHPIDTAKSAAEKTKTIFTENGVVNFVKDKRGNWKKSQDKQTQATEAEDESDDQQRSKLVDTLSGLKDGLFGFFKSKKEKKKEKKSWLEKLLDTPVASFAKKAATIGGAFYGIGKFVNAWKDEGETGPMHTFAQKIGDAVTPVFTKIKDWLTGEGEYKDGGLPGWVEKDFLPNMWGGIDFVVGKILPKLVESLIRAMPSIIDAGLNGIKALIGLGNKHKDDNKLKSIYNSTGGGKVNISNDFSIGGTHTAGVAKYFNNVGSSNLNGVANQIAQQGANITKQVAGSLAVDGVTMYTKDSNGNLVSVSDSTDPTQLNEFYTEEGARYYKDENGNWVSENGNVSREGRDNLGKRFGKAFTKSFLTGRNIMNPITGAGKMLSKIPLPGVKGFGKFTTGIGKMSSGLIDSGAKLRNTIGVEDYAKYVKEGVQSGFKPSEMISDVAGDIKGKFGKTISKVGDNKVGQSILKATNKGKNVATGALSKVTNFISDTLKTLFGFFKSKFKDGLQKAGKEASEKAVKEASDKLVNKLMKEFNESILGKLSEKALKGLTVKVSSFLASGGMVNAVFAIKDFAWGFDQAKSILGIDNVSFSQRFLAGLVHALNNFAFFGIVDTDVIVDWLAGPVLQLFGQDADAFDKQQQEADKIVEEYNKKHGTNYSKQEYYKNQTLTGKVDNFLSDAWQGTKDFFSNLNPFKKKEQTSTTTATGVASKMVEDYANNTKQLVSPQDYAQAGTLAIGSQQETMYQNLSQNILSADAYMNDQLGRIMGFDKGLSEGLAGYNRNKSTKGLYTFTDVMNNANRAMATLAKSVNVSPYANKYTPSSTTTSNRVYGRPYGTSTLWAGVGTMNEGFVSQLDPKYKNKKFNTGKDSEYQTLGDSGCGPATAANVLNLYAGKGTVMDDASAAALRYKDKNSGVTPEYFQNYLGSKGIGTYPTMDKNEMFAGIRSGQPTVLLGVDPTNKANTPYGAAGSHYVLATGMDGKGNVIVQDPESRRPNTLYPARDLINQSHLGMITGKGSRNVRNMKSTLKSKLGNLGFGRGSNTVYQDLAKWSPVSASELNNFIKQYAGSNRGFTGKGEYFIKAAEASGLDPRYILAHAAWETGWGDSTYAKAGNFFGIGAFNSNPDNAYKYGNSDMESGLVNGAKWIRKNYYDAGQTTLYSMVHKPGHNYAVTDDGVGSESWMNGIAGIMDNMNLSNTSAVYHEPDESVSPSGSNAIGGLFDMLGNAVTSYYDENLVNLLFGSNSNPNSLTFGEAGPGDVTSAKQFYEKYNNQFVETDGFPEEQPYQCVDLFRQYQKDMLGDVLMGGNAKDYATNPEMDKYFDRVNLKDAQYGDWVIWGANPTSEYGHIGMYTGMENGKILTFGTNQGSDKRANTIPMSSDYVSAIFRLKAGQGSGKNKSFNTLPSILNNKYSGKGVKLPKLNTNIYSGKGTKLPSLNYTPSTNNFASHGITTGYSMPGSSSSRVENLISVVIDVLRIIADNSSKLSEVVALLSRALDVNLTNDDIKNLNSNNAKIKNKLANALKAQGSSTGIGNNVTSASTESLANVLYSIARA